MLFVLLFAAFVHGRRFIQITDVHYDPFYKSRSDPSKNCHSGKGSAGLYGFCPTQSEAFSNSCCTSVKILQECDSPEKLLDLTIHFIEKNFKNDFDFILWTGDNSRHNIDMKMPLIKDEIERNDEFIVKKYLFSLSSIATVIPSIGSHDLSDVENKTLKLGPNSTFENLYKIWKTFIPIPSVYSFLLYGSYFVEVRKGIFVFSLNTLYFSKKNLVADCSLSKSPGIKLLKWMDENFYKIAEMNGKILISGHIPPLKNTYKPDCLKGFLALMKRYKRIISGQFYGYRHKDEFDVQMTSLHRHSKRKCNAQMRKDQLVKGNSTQSSDSPIINKSLLYKNSPFGIAFMSPALQPSYNPAFRVYHYSENDDSLLTDYDQYVLYLQKANLGRTSNFEIEYSFKEEYSIKSFNLDEIYSLKKKIQNNENGLGDLYEKRKVK